MLYGQEAGCSSTNKCAVTQCLVTILWFSGSGVLCCHYWALGAMVVLLLLHALPPSRPHMSMQYLYSTRLMQPSTPQSVLDQLPKPAAGGPKRDHESRPAFRVVNPADSMISNIQAILHVGCCHSLPG